MKTMLIRGPLLSQSGYGVHSRQIFKWALENTDYQIFVQVLPWGITPWYTNSDACDGLIGEIFKRTAPINTKCDVSMQIQLPNEWDTSLAKTNIGVTAVVETDICSKEWVSACNNMSAVVVPSKFCKQTLLNSGHSGKNLFVISESFIDECNLPIRESYPFRTSVNFLLFGQITDMNVETDRKNTFNAIKWFCETFEETVGDDVHPDDVGLVIKTNCGTNSKIDYNLTKRQLQAYIKNVRKGNYPKIYLLHGHMTNEEVVGLYKHPKLLALLAPTRGEGFGLPILEAAACDLPVIATNWSGHLDFLGDDHWLKVEKRTVMVPAGKIDGRIFVENSKWAEPLEFSYKQKLRYAAMNMVDVKSQAKKLGEKVRSKFSHKVIVEDYNKLFRRLKC